MWKRMKLWKCMNLRKRMNRLAHGAWVIMFVCAVPLQSQAQSGLSFGPTIVTGLVFEVSKPTRQVLFQDNALLSSDSLCRQVALNRDMADSSIADAIARTNNSIRKSIKGVAIVRYVLDLSADCTGLADASTVTLPGGSLGTSVTLRGNRFTFNITTPDAFGIGLPQSADPRMMVTFDLEISSGISIPASTSQKFEQDPVRIEVRNVSLPKGVNFTGDIVEDLAPAAMAVYDYFNNGELSRALTDGHAATEPAPASAVDRINAALAFVPPSLNQIQTSVGDGMLTMLATDGTKIVDPTCISGYVWRNVRPDDLVCVEPSVRAQVRADNDAAADRRVAQPDRARLQLCGTGPVTLGAAPVLSDAAKACIAAAFRIACKPGYVWREAVADDYVCVTPETRQQARDDNSWAPRRRVDYQEVIH